MLDGNVHATYALAVAAVAHRHSTAFTQLFDPVVAYQLYCYAAACTDDK
jgi:hypothetical protein